MSTAQDVSPSATFPFPLMMGPGRATAKAGSSVNNFDALEPNSANAVGTNSNITLGPKSALAEGSDSAIATESNTSDALVSNTAALGTAGDSFESWLTQSVVTSNAISPQTAPPTAESSDPEAGSASGLTSMPTSASASMGMSALIADATLPAASAQLPQPAMQIILQNMALGLAPAVAPVAADNASQHNADPSPVSGVPEGGDADGVSDASTPSSDAATEPTLSTLADDASAASPATVTSTGSLMPTPTPVAFLQTSAAATESLQVQQLSATQDSRVSDLGPPSVLTEQMTSTEYGAFPQGPRGGVSGVVETGIMATGTTTTAGASGTTTPASAARAYAAAASQMSAAPVLIKPGVSSVSPDMNASLSALVNTSAQVAASANLDVAPDPTPPVTAPATNTASAGALGSAVMNSPAPAVDAGLPSSGRRSKTGLESPSAYASTGDAGTGVTPVPALSNVAASATIMANSAAYAAASAPPDQSSGAPAAQGVTAPPGLAAVTIAASDAAASDAAASDASVPDVPLPTPGISQGGAQVQVDPSVALPTEPVFAAPGPQALETPDLLSNGGAASIEPGLMVATPQSVTPQSVTPQSVTPQSVTSQSVTSVARPAALTSQIAQAPVFASATALPMSSVVAPVMALDPSMLGTAAVTAGLGQLASPTDAVAGSEYAASLSSTVPALSPGPSLTLPSAAQVTATPPLSVPSNLSQGNLSQGNLSQANSTFPEASTLEVQANAPSATASLPGPTQPNKDVPALTSKSNLTGTIPSPQTQSPGAQSLTPVTQATDLRLVTVADLPSPTAVDLDKSQGPVAPVAIDLSASAVATAQSAVTPGTATPASDNPSPIKATAANARASTAPAAGFGVSGTSVAVSLPQHAVSAPASGPVVNAPAATSLSAAPADTTLTSGASQAAANVASTSTTATAANPNPSSVASTDATAFNIAAASTPASQVASAIVAFTADGTSHTLTVQLQPEELGRVQISVASDATGRAAVVVSADRPETLALLQRDQPELARALDQAGIPSAGRSVSFQLSGSSTGDFASTVGSEAARMQGGVVAPDQGATGAGSVGGNNAAAAGSLGQPSASPAQQTPDPVSSMVTAPQAAAGGSMSGGSGDQTPPGHGAAFGLGSGQGSGAGGQSGRQSMGQNSNVLADEMSDAIGADTLTQARSPWMTNGLNIIA